jgi:hypothetical protein
MTIVDRVRAAAMAAALAGAALTLGACNPKEELLSPQTPSVISPTDIQSATGAEGLYTGAMGRMKLSLNGGGGNTEAVWNWTGLFTDEFKSGDTFSQRNDSDQRNLQDNDGVLTNIYNAAQQARGHARTAINALVTYEPTAKTKIAELYMAMGFIEMQMSEDFCNGIPFGETVDGLPQYSDPLTTADGLKLAIARFDSALTFLGSASDDDASQVRNSTLVAKGRAQVDLGQFAAAAATVAAVPTSFQYTLNYSQTTADNEWWVMGPSVERYSAGDSIDVTGPVLNAIPFASLNDPRVPVTNTGKQGEDNQTIFVSVDLWGRDDPIALTSGIDARLVEAEAKLQASDFAGMTTILNDLRTAPQTLGAYNVPAMTALSAPGSADAATNLFFREKALWQFGRGIRMDDLRRLVRQYGRGQDTVFPSGNFHKTGTYGSQVAFPVPDGERTNPNFHGCIDRAA